MRRFIRGGYQLSYSWSFLGKSDPLIPGVLACEVCSRRGHVRWCKRFSSDMGGFLPFVTNPEPAPRRSLPANAVRLPLHALAYNLGDFLRKPATPEPIEDWSLTSLLEKLIKIAAKVIGHGRYVALQMAEVGAPRRREEEICKCKTTSEQPCCTRDEGRPLGLGLQDQGPNRHKPLQNNGWGGER